MTKTALITGICGQDGAYLAKLLLQNGYSVFGWARRNASLAGLEKLGIQNRVNVIAVDICDTYHVHNEMALCLPDEIYNLAAQSHVGQSFNNPMLTCQVNYGGYLNVLLAARRIVPDARVYQAGTSEMFGYAAGVGIANEITPFMPMSPYAISKVAAHWAGVNARFEVEQFVSNGILFNHESPLRGKDFVTRKITDFVKTYDGTQRLHMGNLNSVRDWGHAKDYVKAMHAMLQYDFPDDFVIATGNTMSVRNFIIKAFQARDMEIKFEGSGMEETGWVNNKPVVVISSEFYRPNDLMYLRGDAKKAKTILKWEPETSTEDLIEEMVRD